jgi:3-oxoacyl-[acyl-carrier-protein] synthase II
MDFTRSALTGDRPYLVDPARFPNTVMNFAAGQCAIRYGLRGPNATLAAGRCTGLLAVRYGIRLLALRHADRVIAGAVEEMSDQRGRLEAIGRGPSASAVLGEGCALLTLEPAGPGEPGDGDLGVVLDVATRVAVRPELAAAALIAAIEAVLRYLPSNAVLDYHAPYDAAPDSAESRAIAAVTGAEDEPPLTLDVTSAIGDTGAASAMFQLQAVLGVGHCPPLGSRPQYGLITSIDGEGVVGAMLVRIDPPSSIGIAGTDELRT